MNRKPVYVITDVALIPLLSQSSAQEALAKAKATRVTHASDEETDTDISDDDDVSLGEEEDSKKEQAPPTAAGGAGSSKNSGAEEHEDTVGRKGVYGIFAQRWFGRSGWMANRHTDAPDGGKSVEGPKSPVESADDEPGNQDVTPVPPPLVSTEAKLPADTDVTPTHKSENKLTSELESFPALPLSVEEQAEQADVAGKVRKGAAHSLTPKLLHTTRLLFASSRSFFFSYDMDITRPFSQKQQQAMTSEKLGDAPLWTNVDPLVSFSVL